jgi:hypothetical protein
MSDREKELEAQVAVLREFVDIVAPAVAVLARSVVVAPSLRSQLFRAEEVLLSKAAHLEFEEGIRAKEREACFQLAVEAACPMHGLRCEEPTCPVHRVAKAFRTRSQKK